MEDTINSLATKQYMAGVIVLLLLIWVTLMLKGK